VVKQRSRRKRRQELSTYGCNLEPATIKQIVKKGGGGLRKDPQDDGGVVDGMVIYPYAGAGGDVSCGPSHVRGGATGNPLYDRLGRRLEEAS